MGQQQDTCACIRLILISEVECMEPKDIDRKLSRRLNGSNEQAVIIPVITLLRVEFEGSYPSSLGDGSCQLSTHT